MQTEEKEEFWSFCTGLLLKVLPRKAAYTGQNLSLSGVNTFCSYLVDDESK